MTEETLKLQRKVNRTVELSEDLLKECLKSDIPRHVVVDYVERVLGYLKQIEKFPIVETATDRDQIYVGRFIRFLDKFECQVVKIFEYEGNPHWVVKVLYSKDNYPPYMVVEKDLFGKWYFINECDLGWQNE